MKGRPAAAKGMVACAAISMPLMLIFHSAPTRVIGVLTLFGFIVFGVFAVAEPVFLQPEDGAESDAAAGGVSEKARGAE